MKRILTLTAVLLLANTVHAISFNWGVENDIIYVGAGNKVGGIVATLVYLGEKTTSYSIENWVVKNPTALTSGEGVATTTSVSAPPALVGRVPSVKFDLSAGAQVGSSPTDVLTAGSSTFGLFLTYVDGDNQTWYNVSSSTYTIPDGSTDISTGLSTKFSFDWKQNAKGAPLTSGGGWTAVPEPSTAALALAGLALLLKRRKA